MAKKITLETANDGGLYIVREADANGKVETETYTAVHTMGHAKVINVLGQMHKTAGTFRAAMQEFLGEVLANPKLSAYRGKSDPKTGKVDSKLKESMRDAEKQAFSIAHQKGELKTFLPAKSENAEADYQEFVKARLEDNNYKNIRSLCLRYFAFCGGDCVTKSGYLVAPPFMMASVKAMLEITPPDNSYSGQLARILDSINQAESLQDTDIRKAYPIARELLSILESQVARLNELATNATAGLPPTGAPLAKGDIPEQVEKVVARMRRAPKPEVAPV